MLKCLISSVRTFTGAWIETHPLTLFDYYQAFAPSRVRGLKHQRPLNDARNGVRTFTGAWIETAERAAIEQSYMVRTFTGAWIETA